jgi:pyrroloquinoline-quinone synthase
MDRKDHWAWPYFTKPGLSKTQLLVHFRHEYHTYVRDFPVLLARLLGHGPPADVRRALAENIYEEQTGRLSLGTPHPEMFLEMTDGLGIARSAIEAPELEPEALSYRALLDQMSQHVVWVKGAAVLTIYVEGSKDERAELEGRRELLPLEHAIAAHPMVAYYGCPPERLRLVRAHRAIEGAHRKDAWQMVLSHTPPQFETPVVQAVEQAHAAWLAYRDGVARGMGLRRN